MRESYVKAEEVRRKAHAGGRGDVSGIGGWLLLPAAGLVVGFPIVVLQAVWSFQSGDAGEAVVVAAFAVVALGITVMFFRKSRWAPRLMIGLLAFNVVVNLFVVVVGGGQGRAPARRLGQGTLSALVWIPYFLVSKRVKATFTE